MSKSEKGYWDSDVKRGNKLLQSLDNANWLIPTLVNEARCFPQYLRKWEPNYFYHGSTIEHKGNTSTVNVLQILVVHYTLPFFFKSPNRTLPSQSQCFTSLGDTFTGTGWIHSSTNDTQTYWTKHTKTEYLLWAQDFHIAIWFAFCLIAWTNTFWTQYGENKNLKHIYGTLSNSNITTTTKESSLHREGHSCRQLRGGVWGM